MFKKQFEQDYGVLFEQKSDGATAWGRGTKRIIQAVTLVGISIAQTSGGSDEPLQPRDPEITS